MLGFRPRGEGRGVVLLLVMTLVAGSGCAARDGIYHKVDAGENLYRIGKAYGVPYQQLGRVNNISDPNCITVGQRIFVPGARRRLPVSVITPEAAQTERPPPRDLPTGKHFFVWPITQGKLTSAFGPRGDSFHDGIDVSAPHGTPVHAARAGEVLYSDNLRGYGNVIILRHSDGYASVYAHNAEQLVSVADRVLQGQVIARVGESGRTSGPNLHFEVRKNNVARNPLYYLPQGGGPAGVGGGS